MLNRGLESCKLTRGMLLVDESYPSSDHSRVHEDIKSDNISWVQNTFKLADLGFARFDKCGRGIGPPLGGTKTYGIYGNSPS